MLQKCRDLSSISHMCEMTTRRSGIMIWINSYPKLQFPIESSVWNSVKRITAASVRGIEYA